MTCCQHSRATFTGTLGDLIQATCRDCGHAWRIVDQWLRENCTAFQKSEGLVASRVVPQ